MADISVIEKPGAMMPAAGAFTILKPWCDAIGLKGGYVLAPVADVTQERREWLGGKLRELGIA